MKKTLLLLALALLPASADGVADAAAQLRAGDAVAALQSVARTEGAEASFWRGRSLLALKRYVQATEQLQQVPAGHPLFPYAAKALLYCAWQSPEVDADVVLSPLLSCGNEDIATLATAALAEYHLNREEATDAAVLLQTLRTRAAEQKELLPLLHLLEIADLCRKGDFDAAMEQCRRLERDRALPLLTRHRVRLALAEVFYAQEAAHAKEQPAAPTAADDEEADDPTLPDSPVARGRGEETLLHFISSNPESPLLEEAFRRLMLHEAFLGESARERLKEWGGDRRYPRRAALALMVQQHLLNPEDAAETPPDSTCVNAAVAAFAKESATETMLTEQVRQLLLRGSRTEAALYLAELPQDSPRRAFLAAALIDNPAKAAAAYQEIARTADEALQPIAYLNAMLCALKAGDAAILSALEQETNIPTETKVRMRALKAAYLAETAPAEAAPLLRELLKEELPADCLIDVALDAAALSLTHPDVFNDPDFDAFSVLTGEGLTNGEVSEEQTLRIIALREQQYRAQGQKEQAKEAIIISAAAFRQQHPYLCAVLCIHLSHLLSAEGKHTEALQVLQGLTEMQPKGELTPRARMLAARQAELIGSLSSLKTAAEMYGRCAEDNTPFAERCTLRRAAVLSRLGEAEQAAEILRAALRREASLRAEDKALAYALLANTMVQEGTEESLRAAVITAAEMLGNAELPPRWQALTLLHHGMICTRAGKHDLALGDYLAVLRMKPAEHSKMEQKDWDTLRGAAAGAIHEYLLLERFEEAAKQAEETAAWDTPFIRKETREGFRRWAKEIRKTHFLPAAE